MKKWTKHRGKPLTVDFIKIVDLNKGQQCGKHYKKTHTMQGSEVALGK